MKFILVEWYGKKHQFLVYFMSKYHLFLHLAFTAPLSFIITINFVKTNIFNIFNQNISSIDEIECRDSIRWWKFGFQTLIIFWHFKLDAKKTFDGEIWIKKHRILIHVIQFLTLWQEWRSIIWHSVVFEYFECHSKNNLFNETVYSPSLRPNPVSVNWINKHFIFIWFNIYLILYHGLHEATVALNFPTTSSILAMWWSWIGCLLFQMLEKSINVHYKT